MRVPRGETAALARSSAVLLVWVVLAQVGLAQAVERSAMRYLRPVVASRAGLNCAVLDPLLFAHAAVSLRDLRLVAPSGAELPFVLTLSGTGQDETEPAVVSNVQHQGRGVDFSLRMPARPYTDVVLDLAGVDFVAIAAVSAGNLPLGSFAIWDLSHDGLGRSTTLHLQETSSPLLHVDLQPARGGPALGPEMVRGATVPPTRAAQTRYTVAVQATMRQIGPSTVAELQLPPRVPVERVRFVVGPAGGSFRRSVRVQARAAQGDEETVTGEIDRLHTVRDGIRLAEDRLAMPATLGANLQGPAQVRIEIQNNIAAPLPILAVQLQTRERQLCFNAAAAGERLTILYGDPGLHAPSYDRYLQEYAAEGLPAPASLGAEEPNPAFAGDHDARTLRERHPRTVYLGIVLVVCVAGLLLLRREKLRIGGGR